MYTNLYFTEEMQIQSRWELLSPEDDVKSLRSVTKHLGYSNTAAGLLSRRVGKGCTVSVVSEIDPAAV